MQVVADKVYSSIDAHDVQYLTMTVDNYTSDEQSIEFGIASGYKNTEISVDGIEIRDK